MLKREIGTQQVTMSNELRMRSKGSFGLEVSGGQRKFPGGQNSSKVSQGQLNSSDLSLGDQERSELLQIHSPVVGLQSEIALAWQCSLTPSRSESDPHRDLTENSRNEFYRSKRTEHNA